MFHTDGVPAAEATEDGGFPTPDKWNAPDIWNGYFGCPYYSRIHKQCKNKYSYKIKESQNCDSFIIRLPGRAARRDVRFDNGNGAHYNGSNL